MEAKKDMKEPRNSVTKEPKNGVTKGKRVKKNINGVAFKPSKLSKPKRLNAISYKSVTKIWLQNPFGYTFWLHLNILEINSINRIVTKVTKIYSKTNLGKSYRRILKTGNTRTHVYSTLYSFVGFLVTLVTIQLNLLHNNSLACNQR